MWGAGLRGAQTNFVGSLFSAMISKLQNSTSGLYYNEKPVEDGKLALVAVLDPREDPESFIQDLKSLSSFVTARVARDLRIGSAAVDEEEVKELVAQLASDSVPDRSAAEARLRLLGAPAIDAIRSAAAEANAAVQKRANRIVARIEHELQLSIRYSSNSTLAALKPKFLFRRNQRERDRPVIEILLEPGKQTTELNQRMSVLFGGDWKRLRLAVVEDRIVVLFGSNTKLLEKAVASVRQRSQRFAETPSIAEFRGEAGEQRIAEWHFSTWEINPLVQRAAELRAEPAKEFSTITFTRRKAELRMDLFMPLKEFGAFHKKWW